MTAQRTPPHPHFRHEVLIHDDDASLVSATRRFVTRGLQAGADVLVHSDRAQVSMLAGELGSDPRLSYGYDEELYPSPARRCSSTNASSPRANPATRVWVTGTVPLGATSAAQAAWGRYESAVNEALGSFPLRALCTYDSRTTPPAVLAIARATHPGLETRSGSVPSPDYLAPADFLVDPLAEVPRAPERPPVLAARVGGLDDVTALRSLMRTTGRSSSAVPLDVVEGLILAVHEVTANAIVHGSPPVGVTLWADLDAIVVQVRDAGPGGLDPLAGYRFPDALGALGLWVARHEVDDLIIDTPQGGGCRVLLFTS